MFKLTQTHSLPAVTTWLVRAVGMACLMIVIIPAARGQDVPAPSQTPAAQQSDSGTQSRSVGMPRGKKLVMKDGAFLMVREYKIEGDRVKYYSMEEQQWEEMPETLVDWDATKKAVADEAARDASLVSKVHTQEQGRRAQPLDIDASIEAAEGVFLPPGEGLFVFDGKAISQLAQADIDSKVSKKKAIEKVLVPIPLVASRHVVSIQGPRAKLRVKPGQTEFYMRTADGREPEMNLVRAKVHGEKREIANIDEMFKQEVASAKTVTIQRWLLAPGVYRFTLSQTLEPGEYALAEIVQNAQMSIYVWDFGMDAGTAPPAQAPKTK